MPQETKKEDFYDRPEGNRRDPGSNYYRIAIGVGNAQWWATLGAAIFVVGLILIALAYSTLKILPTVPSNYVGIFPSISFEAYSVGIVITAFGFVLMLYARYKLAKLSWTK
jgi:hypothetical protein